MSDNEQIRFLEDSPPTVDLDELRVLVERQYGIKGEYRALYSERDQNFLISDADEPRFVLKISNSNELPDSVDFQVSVLRHIQAVDPELAVPRVVEDVDGRAYFTQEFANGATHIVHILGFVAGVPLDELKESVSLNTRRQIGQLVGRIDIALQSFAHPASMQDHPWDIGGCLRLLPHVHHLRDTDQRELVNNVLEYARDSVLPKLATMRHQVVHQDAHDGNVLVDTDDSSRVVGLIDFGDMLYGSIAAELATTCYAAQSADSLQSICAAASGLDETFPLQESEVDLLFDMIRIRHALSAALVATRAALGPDADAFSDDIDDYVERIRQLDAFGRDAFTAAVRRACRFPAQIKGDTDGLIAARTDALGPHTKHFYDRPLHFERASGVFLHGTDGRSYLDFYNNVPQVGHCNPHVVKAISRQAAALNTNTRYLYSSVVEYAERLISKLAPHLDACIFVNSGSEANDVAWQMARFETGGCGGLLMEDGYHGITDPIRLFSPGHPDVRLPGYLQGLSVPDPYRDQSADIAERYAADADRAITELNKEGHPLAAFMIDSAFCSSGVPDVPLGYLQGIERRVRAAGGLMICDEVQSGFGRMGQWWGHEHHGVMADIVTMGKPAGNGHPLGVVVTNRDLMNRYMKATGFFSTFGGNTVACAAGNAVLDVIERDDLIENGRDVGDYLRKRLRELGEEQRLIGDVRGHGMLAGLELVTDRESRAPATDETAKLLELMREQQVLVGSEGRFANVLKLRPPLVMRREHVDQFVAALDAALSQLPP